MKPVKMDYVSRGVFNKDSLLLLNTSSVGPRYVRQLFARNNTSIRSKGGICLPNEIWLIIFEFSSTNMKNRFCLVKADVVSASPNIVLLRCSRHEFDYPERSLLSDSLKNRQSVEEFQDYLACATPSTAENLDIKPPKLSRLSGPKNTFDIVLDATTENLCLYTCIDVPDIIATMEGGQCWVCQGVRNICPGCTGGIAQEFDVFMGCGVELSCPLCLGMEFSLDHKEFLEAYYNATPPEPDETEWKDYVNDRLEELGYLDSEYKYTGPPTWRNG